MTTPQTDAVVVLASGGLDSTALLAEQIKSGRSVFAITINYGQRHVEEFSAIKRVVKWYQDQGVNLQHEIVDLSNLGRILESVLTRPDLAVPEGHYAEPTMSTTVVPNRNMIMISVAAGYAESVGAARVAIGCHAGDHYIYPDCRPQFMLHAYRAVFEGTGQKVRLLAPYVGSTKADIVARGISAGAPLHLTWSCYQTPDDTGKHCGVCGTCNERKEAFRMAADLPTFGAEEPCHITDPTEYAS